MAMKQFIISLIATMLASCSMFKDIETIEFRNNDVTLEVGEEFSIEWEGYNSEGRTTSGWGREKWWSDNPSIATVNRSGWVTARFMGRTTVHLKVDDKQADCLVTVVPNVSTHAAAALQMQGETLLINALPYREELIGTTLHQYFGDQMGTISHAEKMAKHAIVGNGITKIDSYALSNSVDLADIVLPTSLLSIGSGTFNGCVSLTDVHIPAHCGLGEDGFSGCTSLASVTFAEGYDKTDIEKNLFSGCTNLAAIAIPTKVHTIREGAFKGSGLTSVVLPELTTYILSGAFGGCDGLKTVTCLSPYPPSLASGSFDAKGDTLLVPAEGVARYKANAAWSAAFDKIEDI